MRDPYHDLPGMSWSTLKYALTSPKHLQHRIANPTVSTPAMRAGTALHMALLEPERFAVEAVMVPDEHMTSSGALSSGKATREWVASLGDEPLLLTSVEMEAVAGKVAAIHAHPVASAWLADAVAVEEEMHWTERVLCASGRTLEVLCRGKLDFRTPSILGDLKSFAPRGPLSLRSVLGEGMRRDYHCQAAWYRRGTAACGRDVPERDGWIFIESSAPYDVVCVLADDELSAYGDEQSALALQRYADALDSGYWPGVADEAVSAYLPAYLREDDNDVAGELGLGGFDDIG